MSGKETPTRRVRVVAWNLRHGGGNTRTPEQALFLHSLSPDIVALSEVREARGSQLRVMLAAAGLVHWVEAPAASAKNRVAIASRFALTPYAQSTWRERFVAARIEQLDATLLSVHVPDENNETARAEVWQLVVEHARALRDERVIIAGDFNTQRSVPGAYGLEGHATERTAWRGGRRVGQTCERMMGMLATLGYMDVTCLNVGMQQPTWFGPSGERHAIDGIWVSKPLISPVALQARAGGESLPSAFRETRCVEEGLSDHAAIGVDFECAERCENQTEIDGLGSGGRRVESDVGGLFSV